MAVESTLPQNLGSRNIGGEEPRKKPRKRISIKVSRGSYLRQSSKSSKSLIDWPPVAESSETSGLQQQSLVTCSDSSPNYMKSTSCFNEKKGSSQEGSECDDGNSVVSSSCGSSERVVFPSVMSDDAAMPQHPSAVEESDASPKSLKATSYYEGRKSDDQASLHDSEFSNDSSDHSRTSHYAPSKSIYSGQKSLQTLTRSSSKRAVRILIKKSSFKPKSSELKYPQVSEDKNVERATCSSTIKNSRFPEHVELEPGQTESDRISFVKICPYNHCSLHGHSHDPPPPKKPFLRRRSRSSKLQMSLKPSSGSGPGTKRSVDIKKGAKKHQTTSNAEPSVQEAFLLENDEGKASKTEVSAKPRGQLLREPNVPIEDSNPIEMVLSGSSYPQKENLESQEEIRNSFAQEEDIPESTFVLKESSLGCYSKKTEADISYTSAVSSHSFQNLSVSSEQTNSNQKPDRILVSGFTPVGDSKHKEQGDSEPAVSFGVHKPQFGKGKNISMWHLIHKHMVSGLAAEDGTEPLQGTDEGKQMGEADMDTKKSPDVCPDFPDSDMGSNNHDKENQEIEIRKLFAIKLVREAIERILLPEVQDQLSENQSITSDIVEDPEIQQKNHQEAADEGCHSESGNINGDDNIPADPRVQVHADDSNRVQDIKKSDAKLGGKSDKKSPSNWSNLKKWIILQRFAKELEKVGKLNQRKPRKLQLDSDPGAENISLRRQRGDEKRRAEEWMLDYALQQVVSQLAPTQKRKVALLVKAFETVVPPQEESNIQVTSPKLKGNSDENAYITNGAYASVSQVEYTKLKAQDNVTSKPDDGGKSSVCVEHCETNNNHMPAVDKIQLSDDPCLKSDNIKNSTCEDQPLDKSQIDTDAEQISSLKTDVTNDGSESNSQIRKIDNLSGVGGKWSYSAQSKSCDVDPKSIASRKILTASDENTADNFRAPGLENSTKSEPEHVNLPGIHDDTTMRTYSELSCGDSVPSAKRPELGDMDGKADEPLNTSQSFVLDKTEETTTTENLVSSSLEQQAPALKETKREPEPEPAVVQVFTPLDNTSNYKENEAGQFPLDKQNYMGMWHSVCQHVVSSIATKVGIQLLGDEDEEVEDANKLSAKGSHNTDKGSHVASHHQAEFSRSQVVKLVKEAVQEILSSEIQDEFSDTLSNSSEIPSEQEFSEKDHPEGVTKKNLREIDRSEEGFSLDEENESKIDVITTEECKKAESQDKSNSGPPKLKNWSKLKKLILLKRSIRAMEKSRKLKSQSQQQLPLPSDQEPKKVDLRHQMKDERRKAEQWMLDYAVQHIVTTLTPARKKRVAMLVEAFEAVVPLPNV